MKRITRFAVVAFAATMFMPVTGMSQEQDALHPDIVRDAHFPFGPSVLEPRDKIVSHGLVLDIGNPAYTKTPAVRYVERRVGANDYHPELLEFRRQIVQDFR